MDNKLQSALEDYKNGVGLYPAAEKHKIGWKRLDKVLLELGIKRSQNEVTRMTKSNAVINDDALDELTPESLYWLGFLYADGSLETARPRITLSLTVQDIIHLQKFTEFFGKGIKIRTYPGRQDVKNGYTNCQDSAKVSFSSFKLYNRLRDFGFNSRKSTEAYPHNELKDSRDFWRGVVDGDGWLCVTDKTKSIGLSGTYRTLQGFTDYLNSNYIITKQKPYKDKRKEVHKLEFHGSNIARIIVEHLYRDATVYLDRKYQIYQNWIK